MSSPSPSVRDAITFASRLPVVAVVLIAHGPWLWLLAPTIALAVAFELANWLGDAGDC